MSLYLGTTEITKLRDLAPQSGLDITDLWFGSTTVYTVWQTYEGTLPATLSANGDDMRQYQIYGNTGGVGDRTENEFDYKRYFETCIPFNDYFNYAAIQLKPNTRYTVYTNCLSGTSGGSSQNIETSVIVCPAEITFSTANGGVHRNTPFALTALGSGLCNLGIRTLHGLNSSYTEIYNEPDFANGTVYINIVEGSTVPAPYVPFGYEVDISTSDGTTATTTPIYIGDEPLGEDEYVDYQAGKVYRRTVQVMPSALAETKTLNGITVTCDGEGRYSISGNVTSNVTIRFDIPEFVIPISIGNGGNGTFSMLNNFASEKCKFYFMYGETAVDWWYPATVNRTNTEYSVMGNRVINRISITVTSGATINGIISPMFTDNGVLPETYTPYYQPTDPPVPLPALPTCEGTTIVDYAGSGTAPEKVLLKYRKEGF